MEVFKPWERAKAAQSGEAKPSGMEGMLRALGLGDFLDAIKGMATPENVATIKALLDSGTVEKLLKFADGIEEFNERLIRIEAYIRGSAGSGTDQRDLEPGSGSDDGGAERSPGGFGGPVPAERPAAREPRKRSTSSGDADDGAQTSV